MEILIVDDQRLFADILKKAIESDSRHDFQVTTACMPREVIHLIDERYFDVILMDIHMPNMDGIELTRRIIRKNTGTKILMLTAFGYDDYVRKSMEAGAVGFLLKDISSDELIASILGASRGTKIISSGVFDYSRDQVVKNHTPKEVPVGLKQLTLREREALILVMRGFSNQEIAEKLSLSLQTVKNYLSTIYSKLNVKNRFQAMRLAMKHKVDRIQVD